MSSLSYVVETWVRFVPSHDLFEIFYIKELSLDTHLENYGEDDIVPELEGHFYEMLKNKDRRGLYHIVMIMDIKYYQYYDYEGNPDCDIESKIKIISDKKCANMSELRRVWDFLKFHNGID